MDLGATRLLRQGLAEPRFDAPEDVVAWLGAVQAQDYHGSLWALGSRMRDATEATVEAAIAQRRIVRTWPMRGTLHFVAPADVRWMLALLGPRVVAARRALIERSFGLDAAMLRRSRRAVEKALRDGAPVPRAELYAALDAAGIGSDRMRGVHVTGWLAHHGVICCGPRAGKQPTFVLLDAWIPATPVLSRDEALSRLTLRYFTSHGPATAQDFAWWSGLTVKDAQAGLGAVQAQLESETINGKTCWFAPGATPDRATRSAHLLATFDEMLVGYRDRSAVLDAARTRAVIGINGLVSPALMLGSQVVGTWKRTLGKDSVGIALAPFRALQRTEQVAFRKAAVRYAAFLGKPIALS